MRLNKVYVQHEYAFLLRAQSIVASDIVAMAHQSNFIKVGSVTLFIKKKRPGVIVVIAGVSSGSVICDLLGVVRNKMTSKK